MDLGSKSTWMYLVMWFQARSYRQSPNFTTKDFQAVLSHEPNSIWILKPCQLGEGRHIEILRVSGDTNNPHIKRSWFKSRSKMNQQKNHFVYPRCHDFHFYSMIVRWVRWARKTADLMLKCKDKLAFSFKAMRSAMLSMHPKNVSLAHRPIW